MIQEDSLLFGFECGVGRPEIPGEMHNLSEERMRFRSLRAV